MAISENRKPNMLMFYKKTKTTAVAVPLSIPSNILEIIETKCPGDSRSAKIVGCLKENLRAKGLLKDD